jgi:hypothetical protein
VAACATSPSTPTAAVDCTESGIAPGAYTYTVTAVSGSWTTPSAPANVTVTAGAASELAFTTQPGASTGGIAFPRQPVLAFQDSAGHLVTAETSSVTLALQTPNGATLTCASTRVSATAGLATFRGCAINTAGTYRLLATAGPLTATSEPFTIAVGPAARLAFITSPTGSYTDQPFYDQPVVRILDAGGNTVTTDTSSVKLAITTPAGAGLACLKKEPAATAGVAYFSYCLINKAGTYTLTATDGALTPAISASFTVGPPPTTLAWTGNKTTLCTSQSGTQAKLTYYGCRRLGGGTGSFTSHVVLTDAAGTPVINRGADITVTFTSSNGSASLSSVTIAHGQSVSSSSVVFTPKYGLISPRTATLTGTTTAGSVLLAGTTTTATLNA